MRCFPGHAWLAKLPVAAAALVLLSGCAMASGGGTSSAGAPGSSMTPGQVTPALLHAPLGCPAGTDVLVLQRAPVRLSHRETVVAARCDSGAGSPPSGVFVVDGEGSAAKVVATLVRPSAQVQVTSLAATSDGIRATGLGYSSAEVPRCCPDRRLALVWRVDGNHLVAVN